jgi:hypothetical protein
MVAPDLAKAAYRLSRTGVAHRIGIDLGPDNFQFKCFAGAGAGDGQGHGHAFFAANPPDQLSPGQVGDILALDVDDNVAAL